MKYYKAVTGELISFNPETKIYRIKNNIKPIEISEDDFKKLDVIEIKNQKFSELMNIYFKNIKHSWIYNYTKYSKMDNFEKEGRFIGRNYKWSDIPRHKIGDFDAILVYHWGKVWYMTTMNGYYFPKGQLIDPYTGKLTHRWVHFKNTSPIYNNGKKQIA
jgi:hypothetical protein